MHLALDSSRRCTGLYIVGAAAAGRALRSVAWPADGLLSQAVGKPAQVRQPAERTATAQWYEAGHPVTARWRDGQLVELRIGNATP